MSMWDTASVVRERLALLAAMGPDLDPGEWGYLPSGDRWFYIGKQSGMQGRRLGVTREASDSLVMIQRRWGLPASAAMKLVDRPLAEEA